jgi:hypothetical protein
VRSLSGVSRIGEGAQIKNGAHEIARIGGGISQLPTLAIVETPGILTISKEHAKTGEKWENPNQS